MINYAQVTSERYLCVTWPQHPHATTSLAWIPTEFLSPHLPGLLLHGPSGSLHPQSSRHLQELLKRQLGSDALPVTDASPCSGSQFLPSLPTLSPAVPASLPGCWHTPGPASAGSRASNWKGELQSPKADQLAAREHSAAASGASPRPRAGWQPFVW